MNNLCVGRSIGIIHLSEWNNRRALVGRNLLQSNLKTSIQVQNRASEAGRMGVFYIVCLCYRNQMNADIRAHYVTYRGKGSKEKTEGFEERENWVLLAWILTLNAYISNRIKRSFK